MILWIDACYKGKTGAACGIEAERIDSSLPLAEYSALDFWVEEYMPGSFYLRELPLLLSVLKRCAHYPDIVVVDGYVWLSGNRPGLGARLYHETGNTVPVIGIAKNPYKGHNSHIAVTRGHSKRPLFITAAGIDQERAACMVRQMAGSFRIPDMMCLADMCARRVLDSSRQVLES